MRKRQEEKEEAKNDVVKEFCGFMRKRRLRLFLFHDHDERGGEPPLPLLPPPLPSLPPPLPPSLPSLLPPPPPPLENGTETNGTEALDVGCRVSNRNPS